MFDNLIVSNPKRKGAGTGVSSAVTSMSLHGVIIWAALALSTGTASNLAQWIAEAHGGSIDVQSRRGEGTTFTVALSQEPAPCRRR